MTPIALWLVVATQAGSPTTSEAPSQVAPSSAQSVPAPPIGGVSSRTTSPADATLRYDAEQTTAQEGPVDQADIVVRARPGPVPVDPLQAINEQSFEATQVVDRAVTRPAAMAYQRIIPSPVRDGLRNFFLNLHEVDVFLNFTVQLKPGKAFETAGRFAINTSLGVAGLFDVAKRRPFRLPRRANSLADTLGYYGVGNGPFFYLPLIGPTTTRDFVGKTIDGMVLPALIGRPFTGVSYTLPSTIVRSLDHRAEADERITALNSDPNPYNAMRADYLHRRQAEIDHLRGRDFPSRAGRRQSTGAERPDRGRASSATDESGIVPH